MGTKIIGLSSNLPFDEEQEQDIIKYVEELKTSHKIGQFLATLIRAAFDSPEILDRKDGKIVDGAVTKQIKDLGMSYDRYQFMKAVNKEVNDMKVKVDKIYEMVFKTYELALMGKYIGLEDKAKNEILANFILQKQVKDLQDSLGVQLTSSVFASNKAQDTEKLAEETLEFIINSYDSVVSELKKIVVHEEVVSSSHIIDEKKNIPNTVINNNDNTEDDNTIIDYGMETEPFEPDLGALNSFFSGS